MTLQPVAAQVDDFAALDHPRWEEFLAFWKNVVGSGYSQEDILEEVQMMIEGGSWVDFDDGRTT